MIERNFPVNELRLFASENSHGHKINFGERHCFCSTLKEKCFEGLDLVFFSSGDEISHKWAPVAVQSGAFAVDNSAAFRMSENHKLIVPEINGVLLPQSNQKREVIANPNCSTIQLVMALTPLAVDFGISQVRVATYQSVSGAGREGKEELLNQLKSSTPPKTFPHPIAFNSIPHIGSFDEDGFCSEEVKIRNETRKIMNMPRLDISAFTVRVPTLNGHAEAVWVTLDQNVPIERVWESLDNFKGLEFIPHKAPADYPTVKAADGQSPVYVGRVRKDPNDPKTIMMWVVADNLRKGAALNGLQIAERILSAKTHTS